MLVLGGVALYGLAGVLVAALGRAASEPRPWQVEQRPHLTVVR